VAFSNARPKLKIGVMSGSATIRQEPAGASLTVSAYAQGWDDAAPRDRRHILRARPGQLPSAAKLSLT
jgi:hypothetical protein